MTTKTRSLTLAPDPVARMREIHDLDNPQPVSPTVPEDRNAEALQHENEATQKRSNVETPLSRNTEAPEHSSVATQPQPGEGVQKRRGVMIGVQDEAGLRQLYGDTVANEMISRCKDVEMPSHISPPSQEQERVAMYQPTSAETQPQSNTETQQHRNAATKKRSSVPTLPEAPLAENPVREAMRQALIQPYAADLSKGPTTATTIRIPTEIWERLDMASTLENQTKQDIIAEALKLYLKKIGRGEA